MPFDSQTLPLEVSALIPGQIRIRWTIAGVSGHGHWWHPDDRSLLEVICKSQNEQYGSGTHVVEEYIKEPK